MNKFASADRLFQPYIRLLTEMLNALSCRSSVVQADGVSAGGPEEDGNVGSGAAALWRAAERRLPELPVHRSQPTGDRHAGVFQSQDPVS